MSLKDIELPPDLLHFVEDKVKSGRYGSVTEVLLEAVRLLAHRDEIFGAATSDLKNQIEEGWLASRAGETVDGDEVFDRIDGELELLERATPK